MKKIIFFLILIQTHYADTEIRSIVLVKHSEDLKSYSFHEEERVSTIGLDLPGPLENLDERLSPYIGQVVNEESIVEIEDQILAFFRENHQSLIAVEVFEQDITDGTIAFLVLPAKIDEIQICGNRWFSSNSLGNAVHLESGCDLDESQLLDDLSWINRNPFIHTDIVFSPGKDKGTTNTEILAHDRFPLRVYAGIDNTGITYTDDERFFSGFNTSWGIDTFFTYQFTSAWSFPELLSHYGNFTYFLPWQHQLVIYGGYTRIHPNINDFKSTGTDIQGSLRYGAPLGAQYKSFLHELTGGVDYKLTNSDLFFVGALPGGTSANVPVMQKLAALFQFYLGYRLQDLISNHQLSFTAETFFSPFRWLPHQTDAAYATLRPSAKPFYVYGRFSLGDTYQFCNQIALSGLLRLHVSPNALLPSEQFGLGGYDTVRGYQERAYNADNAVCANFEVRSPSVSFFRRVKNELTFLGFMDYAWGQNNKPSDAFPSTGQLWSVGPGLRYIVHPYMTFRLDYGFKLHDIKFANHQLGRFHFSFIAGY